MSFSSSRTLAHVYVDGNITLRPSFKSSPQRFHQSNSTSNDFPHSQSLQPHPSRNDHLHHRSLKFQSRYTHRHISQSTSYAYSTLFVDSANCSAARYDTAWTTFDTTHTQIGVVGSAIEGLAHVTRVYYPTVILSRITATTTRSYTSLDVILRDFTHDTTYIRCCGFEF